MKLPVRYFILMRTGLSILLTVQAMPLHAEVFPGEKAGRPVQIARLSYSLQHATPEGAAASVTFREERRAGMACERAQAQAMLSIVEARTASIPNQVHTLSQYWGDTEVRLKPHAEAIQPLSPFIERLPIYPVETLLPVAASLNADLHAILILQGFTWQSGSRADGLQLYHVDHDASLTAAKAAQKAADVLDHDTMAAHEACAAIQTEANATARYAAAAMIQSNDPPVGLAALAAEQRAEVKFREKARNAPKRRPIERAEAAPAREAASAHPNGLCAIATAAVSRVRLQPPVHGVIVKDWGEATDAGPATGVSYQVTSGARVVSPCGGRVVFADSFRSYRQLLIVDCGGGYHIVLSGLEKLDVQPGQTIGTGEPVGVMPSDPGSTSHRQVLYIELRHNGHPVNPALWLRNSG